jgi:hypothetical protein
VSGRDFDPATTKIKRSKVGNMGNDRLHARRNQLGKDTILHPGQFRGRMEWAYKVAELSSIEGELVGRGELERGYTRSANPAADPETPPGYDPNK